MNLLVPGFVGNRLWKQTFEWTLGHKLTFLRAVYLFVSGKICFYFGLKDNSTSTHFLLAANHEVH